MKQVSYGAPLAMGCLFSATIVMPAIAGEERIQTMELSTSSAPRILALAKGRVEALPSDAQTRQGKWDAFRKIGDIAPSVSREIVRFMVASERFAVLDHQRVADLVGKALSDVAEKGDMTGDVKQGEYLLVKRMGGGYAILLVKSVKRDKGVTLSWVLNSGGDAPFGQEEITAILEAGQPRQAAVQTGVATIRRLWSSDTTVFVFEDGKAKPFTNSVQDVRSRNEGQKYMTLLRESGDIAYDGPGGAFVLMGGCQVLGRGALADFAGRDTAIDTAIQKKNALQGNALTPGTVVAVRTRGRKSGLIRIESAGTNELKFQWAYLPDGSSVFPKVAPLPDAAPTPPEPVRDIKAEAQDRLKGLVMRSRSERMEEAALKAEFQKAIADGADVNGPGQLGTPNVLCDAVCVGSKGLVELMIAATERLNESQALHAAAYEGRSDICRLLIQKGADRSYRNQQGLTAFEVAKKSSRSTPEVLAICQPDGDEKLTVHDAAMLGKIDILKRVIAQGADVNGYDSQGKTPLQYAAEAGQAQACEVLIAAGAVVEKGTQYKNALPMNLAVRAGRKDVIRLLMKHASKKQIVDALSQAVKDRHQDVAGLIVQDTPDVPGLYRDAPDQIDGLLRMEHKGLYSLLMGKGVPLPLWAAAVFGDTNVIAKAIRAGEEIDKPGTDFWAETPLQGAVRSRQHDVAKLLLAAGADPSRKSLKRGRNTPLHDAARDRDDQMVALLLQHKADFDAAEEAGRTPLVVAVEMHALPVARRLIEAGADAKNVQTSKLDPDDDKELIGLLRKHGAK